MRLTILAVLSAALCAAVAAHVGIDIAGDYLLPDDTYDHVAHGSRELFTAIAMCCAAGAGAIFVRRTLAAAARLRTRVRLWRFTRARALSATGVIAALSLAIVPLMETLDTLRSGGEIDSLADAFGGSLLLGGSITLACALVCGAVIFALLGWICRHRDTVVRILGALLARETDWPGIAYAQRNRATLLARLRERRAQRRSKRAPPLPARLQFAS